VTWRDPNALTGIESDAGGVDLRLEGIEKAFSGVRVLQAVSFDLRGGEVHTLMGENGAGKSTLMKILAGVYQPDGGIIRLDGRGVTLASPHAAQRQGIALIHQEPLSFPDLSVAENIFIGRGMPVNRAGLLDWPTMRGRAREVLGALGVDLDPRARVRGLSVALQQMVELAAALAQRARILLMDEPTAALTPREVEDLFRIVRQLRAARCGVVFISHRLPEVFGISDRITVLRDGQLIGTRAAGQTTPEEIIRMMVGRELGQLYDKTPTPRAAAADQPLLEVRGLSRQGCFQDISLELKAGEIVGLAGLVGAGRTDVGQALFGITPAERGAILRNGRPVQIRSPQDAAKHKIAYVPEDRQRHGLFPPMSVGANTAMADLRRVSRWGWLLASGQRRLAEAWRDKLSIRLRDVYQSVRELSGGNQQKVVLARWLQTDPEVLILDEPTRGIDVGAKAEVHRLMTDLARQGKAILMISSDLPEVLAMSDRVLVMREGRLTGAFARTEATQESIMAAATGQGVAEAGSARRKAGTSGAAKWMRFRELAIALVVLLGVLVASLLEPRFFSLEIFRSIVSYIPLIVIIAMGQMMVIVTRNIDLSVGSVLGFAAIIVGSMFITHPDMPLGLAALLTVLIGGALGLVNGALVAFLRVPAIIATLGTFTAYRGLIFIYSGGKQVDTNFIPANLVAWSRTSPVGIPWIVLYAAAVALATAFWLRFTRTGREVFAVGSNPPAAALRGINVRRVLLLVFTITGALSGFAGLLYASRFGYVNPDSTGRQMELIVISAVVIGGTNVFGGSGTVLGTVLGCLLLGLIYVALPMIGVSTFWQLAVYGAAILGAATIDTLIQRHSGAAGEVA
jgi:rhamnose transport system ATP-binding protein